MKIETLSTGEVFLYSLVGLVVVIASLAVLACMIMLISKLVARFASGKAPEAPAPAAASKPAAPAASAAAKPAVMATAGELVLRDVDDQTAALLMAIVADQTKIPLNELRFKSIKCLNP
ncbi:MAG: OadG family transporter subunit [Eubacteriales bacterium]